MARANDGGMRNKQLVNYYLMREREPKEHKEQGTAHLYFLLEDSTVDELLENRLGD